MKSSRHISHSHVGDDNYDQNLFEVESANSDSTTQNILKDIMKKLENYDKQNNDDDEYEDLWQVFDKT